MQPQPTRSPLVPSESGVLVVDGYGIKLWVERGHLVISDGIGPIRREARFARPIPGFRRLVLRGFSGFATLESLRWLADVGIGWIHLDPDGRVLATSASVGLDDSRLRRAQAAAWGTSVGLDIARDLLCAKLNGQSRVAGDLPGGEHVVFAVDRLLPELEHSQSPAELMLVEAAAAAAYWDAWATVEMPWIRDDQEKVSEHWRSFGGRASPLTGNPRLAANPANAMLNYLYAILEAEARLACLGTGLDPGLGVLHADQKSRDSLALDVMEAVRPDVDAYVLELLRSAVFRADDFHETRTGVCRVLPPLSHRLAESAPHWGRRLAPVVERVAHDLADGPRSGMRHLPTRLTQANRSAGRELHKRRPAKRAAEFYPRPLRQICRRCGRETTADQNWCEGCRPAIKLQAGQKGLAAARSQRANLHQRGLDPASSPASRIKRAEARLRRYAEEVAWDNEHPEGSNPEAFSRTVLPVIAGIPIRRLAKATGLSVGYCGLIRRGLRVPHPRWWSILLLGAGQPKTHPRDE